MVSLILPSRNERFLQPTIADVLAHARGDIEVIVCLDGYWVPPVADPRVHYLHRGEAVGMRDNINAAAAIAKGEWLMKLDAHCLVADGFDLELAASCDRDWIMVPRRYALDPEAWTIKSGDSKYPVDYHYLSFPFERPDDPTCGLHGTPWKARRRDRAAYDIDDEMSSQGSCWFMHRDHFRRIGPMDSARYGPFVSEFQELGMKTWLGGGRVKVNKRTHYAHLFKGKQYGRGYALGPSQFSQGPWVTQHWMRDQWEGATRSIAWLVEQFWPVPGWPDNWQEIAAKVYR